MIRIKNISKSYDGVAALREVSFDVGKGEILGLVGPNGSGKTTLLKSLVGVVRPDSGQAWIAGVDSTEDALEARKHVGYAPGDPALDLRKQPDGEPFEQTGAGRGTDLKGDQHHVADDDGQQPHTGATALVNQSKSSVEDRNSTAFSRRQARPPTAGPQP